MKKLLVLGGKPIGSEKIVSCAKDKGIYTIVTDYLPEEQSPAKKIADENWDMSVADVDLLAEKAVLEKIDGVIAGVHEFCIRKGIEICEKAGLPSWCTLTQWDICNNKKLFKQTCAEHGIAIARTYKLDDSDIPFPVIVKPVDSDGSRGFSICHNRRELEQGVTHAMEFSEDYLIEEFMQCDACIIHYTAVDGRIIFSGISDKISKKLEGGSMVMALQLFPSKDEQRYLETVNERAVKMFEDLGIQNSPIWIEAFHDGERFVFNEMALRLGGSMTNYPVKYFTGIDQMELIVDASLGGHYRYNESRQTGKMRYAILPIHVKEGIISRIMGLEEMQKLDFVQAVVQVHQEGDKILPWGTAQQVFCYIHMTFMDKSELLKNVSDVRKMLHVKDIDGNEQLLYLMDLSELEMT